MTDTYDETFTCEECNLVLDWDLYVYFKLDDDLDGEPYRIGRAGPRKKDLKNGLHL